MSLKKCIDTFIRIRKSDHYEQYELSAIRDFLCDVYDLDDDQFVDKVNRQILKNEKNAPIA